MLAHPALSHLSHLSHVIGLAVLFTLLLHLRFHVVQPDGCTAHILSAGSSPWSTFINHPECWVVTDSKVFPEPRTVSFSVRLRASNAT